MAINPFGDSEILRPVNPWFITFSLLAAMLFKFIPIDRNWITPDLLALVLVFWNIRQPRRIGIGVAWCFGGGCCCSFCGHMPDECFACLLSWLCR